MPPRGIELQFRTRSRILETNEGEALAFGFHFGPIHIFCIANMPRNDVTTPLVYIKLSIQSSDDWQIFKRIPGNSEDRENGG